MATRVSVYLDDGDVRVLHGDCIDVMRELAADSIDAIITDPPYGLEFMGKDWDSFPVRKRGMGGSGYESEWAGGVEFSTKPSAMREFQAWCTEWATEALRVLKPGGHLAAFGGTRTAHRLACGIEDAGFEIRDTLAWLYGSGFPKSLDVSKAIDKAAGVDISADERWQGWGTALKPAHEPITLARKPLRGTVAANVLAHATGALNIDACRIEGPPSNGGSSGDGMGYHGAEGERTIDRSMTEGRWPANVILDAEAAAILDQQAPNTGGGGFNGKGGAAFQGDTYGDPGGTDNARSTGRIDANGGASRFFYTAKASGAERNDGLHDLPGELRPYVGKVGRRKCQACGAWEWRQAQPDLRRCECAEPAWENVESQAAHRNTHPTVKPVDLMRWLIRLLAPPGALILDPFAGSGTTGVAARLESTRCILIEREAEYLPIIAGRLSQQSLLS